MARISLGPRYGRGGIEFVKSPLESVVVAAGLKLKGNLKTKLDGGVDDPRWELIQELCAFRS